MEIFPLFLSLSIQLLVLLTSTALCTLALLFTLRISFSKTNRDRTVLPAAAANGGEERIGPSLIEQLMPEITSHALSYLDFTSLCNLSMTNSLMRKAADDDVAWKHLYLKDFSAEQEIVTPIDGWKAYYADTRAVMNVNAEFFDIIRNQSLEDMCQFWLDAEYVKCIHPSGELFSGYDAVIQSWQTTFSWEQIFDFELRDARARVLTDMAWVTMVTYLHRDIPALAVTNLFEFHNGRWYLVHHHSSMMGVEINQRIFYENLYNH